MENLQKRKCRINANCVFCGEHDESINHLLFACKFSKEVWELSPVKDRVKRHIGSEDIESNINMILADCSNSVQLSLLYPYLGWRIWKTMNDLIFRNRKWSIPEIINKALVELNLWMQANENIVQSETLEGSLQNSGRINQHYMPNQFCCFVDASWTSPEEKAGFGWILKSMTGREIMRGCAFIEPVMSSQEAEAIALREAMLQLRRWGYQSVTFCGDAKELYQMICNQKQFRNRLWKHHDLATYLEDFNSMMALSPEFRVEFVKRDHNIEADRLAKYARTCCLPYIVSWS